MSGPPPQVSRTAYASGEARRPTALPTKLEDPSVRQYVSCTTLTSYKIGCADLLIATDNVYRGLGYPIYGLSRQQH